MIRFIVVFLSILLCVERHASATLQNEQNIDHLNVNRSADIHNVRLLPTKRFLLITGCARSGTTYITNLLQSAGLKLRKERLGKDGCVAWQAAVDTNYARWWRGHFPYGKIEFDIIFHQVRDPLLTISSLYNRCSPEMTDLWAHFWDYVSAYTPEIKAKDSLLIKCAKYWYYWNLAAEQRASWTYRIEDIDTAFYELERRIGVKLDRTVLKEIPRNTNHRKSGSKLKVTWRMLERLLDPELFENIKALALRYGYPVIDKE